MKKKYIFLIVMFIRSEVIVNCNYDDQGIKTGISWYCWTNISYPFKQ